MTTREDVAAALEAGRVMAILRYREGGDVSAAMAALADGGVRVIEVTVDTPGAWAAIEKQAQRSDLLLGAGTVTTTEQVRRVADLGGSFVVSPGFDAEVVEAAYDRGLAALPGVTTGTEVLAARRAGVELFKLFPAGALGTQYLVQLRGPFGNEAFVPTGGIAIAEVGAWLEAGAFAVALGSDLAGRVAPASAAEVDLLTARAEVAVEHAGGGEPNS